MTWNAEQYLRFGGHRLRPVLDLIAAIHLSAPARVIDLGCGPGNATMLLRERWPGCELTGLDNDAAMLTKARADYPGERWITGDIAAWAREGTVPGYDLVFTNAALHWLPDHASLFPALLRALAPGGVLACQMPRNFRGPQDGCCARPCRMRAGGSAWRGSPTGSRWPSHPLITTGCDRTRARSTSGKPSICRCPGRGRRAGVDQGFGAGSRARCARCGRLCRVHRA